jgi:hypothetical protein
MPFGVPVSLFGVVPGRIASGVRRDDPGRVSDRLSTDQVVVLAEMQDI